MVTKDARMGREGYPDVGEDPTRWQQTFIPRSMSRIDNSLPSLRQHVSTEPDPIFDARRRDSPRSPPLSARSHSSVGNLHVAQRSPRFLARSQLEDIVYERERTRYEGSLSARDYVTISSARLRHSTAQENADHEENEDVLVQKALDVVAERISRRETLSTPRTPRLPSSNTTRFVDFPHKTEFSTRKPVRMADCALHNESKRSLSMSSLTSDGESESYDEEFSPMSETGMIALASNEKDDHPVQEHGEGCDGEEKLISMQEALQRIYSVSLEEMVRRGAASPPADLLHMRLKHDDWLRHFKIAGVDDYLSVNMKDMCEGNQSGWIVEKHPEDKEENLSKKIDFQESGKNDPMAESLLQSGDMIRRQIARMQEIRKTEMAANKAFASQDGNDGSSTSRQAAAQRGVPSLRIENILQDGRTQFQQREIDAQCQQDALKSSQPSEERTTKRQQIISKAERWVQDMQILSERGLLPESKSPRFRALTPRGSRSALPDGVTIKAEVVSPARVN